MILIYGLKMGITSSDSFSTGLAVCCVFPWSIGCNSTWYHKNADYMLIQLQNGKPCHKATGKKGSDVITASVDKNYCTSTDYGLFPSTTYIRNILSVLE